MYDIDWKIGGVGGMGAMGVGNMFSKILMRNGYYVTDCSEYNSIIKGGHNNYQVRCSSEKIYTFSNKINLLVALDEFSLSLCSSFKDESSFVICDWAIVKNKSITSEKQVIDIPLSMINKGNGGDEIMKNIIGLGASLALIGAGTEAAKQIITEQFTRKGDDVVAKNILLLEKGYAYVSEKYPEQIKAFTDLNGSFSIKEGIDIKKSKMYLATGNELISIGAVNMGVGYYSAYPMTPATSILEDLAALATKYNIVVKQAEDEISAMNSAIGASYGGARAMVATSGGGFSLMVEALGMAAISEMPIVAVVVSRPGPSTGLPTWTDQGDLRFVLHASQGEFLRILFTPGDPVECFELTRLAFELSEKYHLPALLLSDKYLAESHWSCEFVPKDILNKRYGFIQQSSLDRIENYERYADTPSGVTPRSIPGMTKGVHLANSDEHNFYGLSDETMEMRNIQLDKRYTKKLKRLQLEMPPLNVYGNIAGKIGIIAFGSVKNQVLEAIKTFDNIKFLHLSYVSPFPAQAVEEFINSVDKFFVIENNMTGQLTGLIKENVLRKPDSQLLKDDGRPLYYEEIIEFLKTHGS